MLQLSNAIFHDYLWNDDRLLRKKGKSKIHDDRLLYRYCKILDELNVPEYIKGEIAKRQWANTFSKSTSKTPRYWTKPTRWCSKITPRRFVIPIEESPAGFTIGRPILVHRCRLRRTQRHEEQPHGSHDDNEARRRQCTIEQTKKAEHEKVPPSPVRICGNESTTTYQTNLPSHTLWTKYCTSSRHRMQLSWTIISYAVRTVPGQSKRY